MTCKLNYIPDFENYDFIKKEMRRDLDYRLSSRQRRTSLGRPLYQRINIQIIMTQECPYRCPFCLERKHPMKGLFNATKQEQALREVLKEHPDARLTITGGEPGLYPEHVKSLVKIFKEHSNNVFCSINTSGFSKELNGIARVNLSVNDYVHPDPKDFPHCTVQTIFEDRDMTLKNIKLFMDNTDAESFSFRFLCSMDKDDYNVGVFREIKEDKEIETSTFRIGDFFTYLTFNYNGKHARITIGDMSQQQSNDYKDGYSNIIIHPDGRISTNWR